eukprot:gene30457-55056_t
MPGSPPRDARRELSGASAVFEQSGPFTSVEAKLRRLREITAEEALHSLDDAAADGSL